MVFGLNLQHMNLQHMSLQSTTFPDCKKIAKVSPLFKSGDRTNKQLMDYLEQISQIFNKFDSSLQV